MSGRSLDFLHGLHAARRADGDLFAAELNDAAARVLDVLADGVGEFAERHADALELVRVGLDDDLLFVTAAGVHLRQAGRGAQARLDDVIVDQLQLHQLRLARRRFVRRVRRVFDDVVKNFAETGADGRELGREAGRQFIEHRLQPLADQLARAVDVRAVLEDEGDLRQAELGERAQFGQAGNAGHLVLDGEGDELFDFLRRERGDWRC